MMNKTLTAQGRWLIKGREYDFASMPRRLIGAAIDSLIVIIVGCIVGLVAGVAYSFVEEWVSEVPEGVVPIRLHGVFVWIGVMLVTMPAVHAMLALSIASKGETPGHRMTGCEIVSKNGEKISRRRAMLRELEGKPLFCVPLLVILLIAVPFLERLIGVDAGFFAVVLWYLPVVSLVLTTMVAVSMGVDPMWQGWHDKLADTVVVKVR